MSMTISPMRSGRTRRHLWSRCIVSLLWDVLIDERTKCLKGAIHMTEQTVELRVNPADETIRLGSLSIRFLLTGEDSGGSIATFEVVVPAVQGLAAPAHSHDQFEETIYGVEGVLTWTVEGRPIAVGP